MSRIHLKLPGSTPLAEARSEMLWHIETKNGVECPCCNRTNKVYPRGIHWQSAAWLCVLIKKYITEPRWYAVTEFSSRGGDYAKLRYWDLVELKKEVEGDKRTSGLWKPTKKGIEFAQGKIRIPSKALIYNGNLLGFDCDNDVDILDILETSKGQFRWSEVMKRVEI